MNVKFIRVYKKIDIDDVKEHMMICGDLSYSCSKCNDMTLKLDMAKCPECGTDFRYISFRNVKDNIPKMLKISESSTQLTFVDYDDYKKMTGAAKAQDFFK